MNKMVSIYEMKKIKIDFIIIIYLIFVTLLNLFVALNKSLAFVSGTSIGNNVVTVGKGITLEDLIYTSSTTGPGPTGLQTLVWLLFIILFVLLFLNLKSSSNFKKNNFQALRQNQMYSTVGYIALIIIYFLLFSIGTKATDYQYIRIYGPALFSLLGLLSFLILGILQIYWIIKSVRNVQSNSFQEPIVITDPFRQRGMNLIIVYQIILGLGMILLSFFLYVISTICISFGAFGGCSAPPQNNGLELGLFIIILWGLLGIISAIFFRSWNYYGYLASWFFLISTGLLLSVAYLIPTFCMIISLYYFKSNKQFKENLMFIKSQNPSHQTMNQIQ